MSALVPFTGKQVGTPTNTGSKVTITAPVKQAMDKLVVCYAPQPGETAEDRGLMLRTWAEETVEFRPEIVSEALHKLLRENPRAPFRPCLKDVIDYCHKVQKAWLSRVDGWYFGWSDVELPSWCAGSFSLQQLGASMKLRADNCNATEDETTRDLYWGITPDQRRGWKLANDIGKRLADWPRELLKKYGVLSGENLDLVSARIAEAHGKYDGDIVTEWVSAADRVRWGFSNQKLKLNELYTEHHVRLIWNEVAVHSPLYRNLAKDPRARRVEEIAA
jgi:hypothetical protein